MKNIDEDNEIDLSAKIDENVIIGKFNKIGKNVVIQCPKNINAKIDIGDCNIINDNTRIFIGEGGLTIGDWNVFHNDMLIIGGKSMKIGHNCWFGQNTIIDSSGGLEIGNGVRVGMYSQIWTHVASGELIEGCTLYGMKKTTIEDDVWLVGSCMVSSGITLGEKGICLSGSNITKDTLSNSVYSGSPAKIMEKLNFYKPISTIEKLNLMLKWVENYCSFNNNVTFSKTDDTIILYINDTSERLIFICEEIKQNKKDTTYFSLKTKHYTKQLTSLERDFYRFIYGYKARFIPII